MIPFHEISRRGKSTKMKSRLVGEGRMRSHCSLDTGFYFGSNENVLEPNSGGGCTTARCSKRRWIVHLEMVKFFFVMWISPQFTCEFHLNLKSTIIFLLVWLARTHAPVHTHTSYKKFGVRIRVSGFSPHHWLNCKLIELFWEGNWAISIKISNVHTLWHISFTDRIQFYTCSKTDMYVRWYFVLKNETESKITICKWVLLVLRASKKKLKDHLVPNCPWISFKPPVNYIHVKCVNSATEQ